MAPTRGSGLEMASLAANDGAATPAVEDAGDERRAKQHEAVVGTLGETVSF